MNMKMFKRSISVFLSVLMMLLTVFSAAAEVSVDPVKAILQGKKILFVGDSITKSQDKSGWPGRIQNLFGADSTNAGVGGASISTVVEDNHILTQLMSKKDNEYDYVIMHGGVNDAWQLAPVGEMSDSFNVLDFDNTTYAGGLEELFYNAFANFDGAKFGFIINYSRPGAAVEQLRNMSEYFTVAKRICEKWGISYFDMYWGTVSVDGEELAISSELLLTHDDTYFKTDTNNAGDIHVNASGYDLIAPYIGEWISTIEHNEYHGTYNNPLAGKSALFLGDSITEAKSDGNIGWGGRIAAENGMTYLNAGSGGAALSTVKDNRVITKFNETRLNKYDYVIMQGGVNDAVESAPIGEVSYSFEVEDFDTATFAGGLEELFYNARKHHANAALGYIINYATPNSEQGGNTRDMSAYFEVAKKVCDKWNVAYLDLYSGSVEEDGETLSYSDDILKVNTAEYMLLNDPGEVQISSLGYDVIAPYIGEWMKTLKLPEGVEAPLADLAEQTPINGDFETGLVGTDVYGWRMESMKNDAITRYGNYQNNFSFKTAIGENGKIAQFSKNGSGYVSVVSKKIAVAGSETYKLSYDYRKSVYSTVEGYTDTKYLGMRPVIRQYKADGTEIEDPLRLTHLENGVNTTSEKLSSYFDTFVTNAEAAFIEVCFWMGGQVGMRCTVELDNVTLNRVDGYINDNFDKVTYEADGGRVAGIAGPADWTLGTSDINGDKSGKGAHLSNYAATVETENGNNVMKLSAVTASGFCEGYVMAKSQSFAVEANKLYNVCFNMKCEIIGANADHLKVIMVFTNENGGEISRVVQNLGRTSCSWTLKTKQFKAPEGAASAVVGFWIGDRNADYTTINFYIDDVSVSSATEKLGFVKETTDAVGAPRTDSRDFTPYWDVNQVNDGAEHRNALMLSVTNGSQSYGGVTFFSKPVAVTANDSYSISFDYKLKGNLHIYSANNRRPYGASFVVYYLDEDGNRIDKDGNATTAPEVLFALSNKDTVDWMYSGVKSVTAPENAVAIQYGLVIGSYSKGVQDDLKYYFDHIVIEKTAEFDAFTAEIREQRWSDSLSVMLRKGDIVFGNGKADIRDLIRIKGYAEKKYATTEPKFVRADMNDNGYVTEDDMLLLRYRILGIKNESDINR